jgi:hypothetical protein
LKTLSKLQRNRRIENKTTGMKKKKTGNIINRDKQYGEERIEINSMVKKE